MELSKEFLELIIKNNERQRAIEKVLRSATKSAVDTGENWNSDLMRAELEVILKNGKVRKKSVIIKKLPEDPQKRSRITVLWQTEVKVYDFILPQLEDIMKEFQLFDPMWPKCLHSSSSLLVLQDLTETGYKILSRQDGLDLDHTITALESIGRFHALTIILTQRGLFNPISCPCFSKSIIFRPVSIIAEMLPGNIKRLIEAIETYWGPKWKPVADQLKDLEPRILEFVSEKVEACSDKFKVLNHGDCWVNNILFKYKPGSDSPIHASFIDFQIMNYRSYVYDLSYFLCLSPSNEILREHWDKVLFAYQRELERILRSCGYNEPIPSADEVVQDIDKAVAIIFAISITVMALTHRNKGDCICVESLLKEGEPENIFLGNVFIQRQQTILEICLKKGLLD